MGESEGEGVGAPSLIIVQCTLIYVENTTRTNDGQDLLQERGILKLSNLEKPFRILQEF